MTIFHITSGTSVLTTVSGDHAFNSDSAVANSLIVDQSAFLVALGSNANGALLANTGAWTVTVNGSVFSKQAEGIFLASGNAAASTITVGVEGEVGGAPAGIEALSAATINNAGVIAGVNFGIKVGGPNAHTIANSGIIGGTECIIDVDGISNNTLTNSGTLNGAISFGTGNDTVTNSGAINGIGLGLGGGTNKLTNTGAIAGDIVGGSGNDTVTNSKTIGSDVKLLDGTNTLTNNKGGLIGGDYIGGSGDDAVTNSATISGEVNLGDGNNTFTNNKSSTIGLDVIAGIGNDTFTNVGTIASFVALGDGTNTLTNSGSIGSFLTVSILGGSGVDTVGNTGTLSGIVDLKGGDDKFTGGNNVETVRDGNGADTYSLGGGDDRYIATGNTGADGIDTVDGGKGFDTYDASAATSSVAINLDTTDHNEPAPGFLVAANTATGTDVAGASHDTITNFENANGGSGSDLIYGNALNNVINGGGNADALFGFAGNDTMNGGAGNDLLVGGAGKDVLTGSSGADVFKYNAITDSTVNKAGRDVITDFSAPEIGSDHIDLTAIDANTTNGVGTNDAFTFIGFNVVFGGVAGQLRGYFTASGVIIDGDVNGDAKPDFAIELTDPAHNITANSLDFFL